MKKNTVILFVIALVFHGMAVQAQTPTASITVTPNTSTTVSPVISPTPVDTTLQKLKEKVASKISERMKNTKAVSGSVTKVGDKSLIIQTDSDTLEIKLDDALTNYYQISGTTTKELKKSNIEKDDYIIATGPQFDKAINANVIYVDTKYVVTSGRVTVVNKDDFSLGVVTEDKENYTLDVQTATLQQIIDIKTLELSKIGFSKYKEGDTIHFIIKKPNGLTAVARFDAERILIIPQEYFLK